MTRLEEDDDRGNDESTTPGRRYTADCPLTRFDHFRSRRFSIRMKRRRGRRRRRDNWSDRLAGRGTAVGLLGTGTRLVAPRMAQPGDEGKREAEAA